MKGMASMDLASSLAPVQARGAQPGSPARSDAGASNASGFGSALNDAVSSEAASAAPRSSAPGANAPGPGAPRSATPKSATQEPTAPSSAARGSAAPVRGDAGPAKKRPAAAGQDTAPAALPAAAPDNASAPVITPSPGADAGIRAASALFPAGIQPAPTAGPGTPATPIEVPMAPVVGLAIVDSTQPLADPRLALQTGAINVPAAGLNAAAAVPVAGSPAAAQPEAKAAAAGTAATAGARLPGVVFAAASGQTAGGQSFGGDGGQPATQPAPGTVAAVDPGQGFAASAGVQPPATAAVPATPLPTASAATSTPAAVPAGAATTAMAGVVAASDSFGQPPAAPADNLPAAAVPGVTAQVDGLTAAGVVGSMAAPQSTVPAQTAAAPQAGPVLAPAPQPALQPQLAKPLFTLAGAPDGQHIMTLKVTPEDLGPLTVRAHIDGTGVRIELFAPGDTGREALRGILPELRRELANSGFGASLDVSDHNSPAAGGGQETGQGPGRDGFQPGGGAGSGSDSRNGPGATRPGHRWDALADEASLRTARILNGPQTTLDILV